MYVCVCVRACVRVRVRVCLCVCVHQVCIGMCISSARALGAIPLVKTLAKGSFLRISADLTGGLPLDHWKTRSVRHPSEGPERARARAREREDAPVGVCVCVCVCVFVCVCVCV